MARTCDRDPNHGRAKGYVVAREGPLPTTYGAFGIPIGSAKELCRTCLDGVLEDIKPLPRYQGAGEPEWHRQAHTLDKSTTRE